MRINNIFGGDIRGIYRTDAVFCPHYFDGSHFLFHVMAAAKKQQKRRQEMLNSMKTGAKVITIGGIYGTIVELHEDYAMLRIAEKTEVKITRQSISQVLGKKEGE